MVRIYFEGGFKKDLLMIRYGVSKQENKKQNNNDKKTQDFGQRHGEDFWRGVHEREVVNQTFGFRI